MISDDGEFSCYQQRYNFVRVCTAAGCCSNSVTGNTAAANKSGCCGSCSSSGSTTATAAEWRDPDSSADSHTKWRDSTDSGTCSVLFVREQQLKSDYTISDKNRDEDAASPVWASYTPKTHL
jgi:hypothetical protein